MVYEMRPVGMVRGGRTRADDDHWGGNRASIVLDPEQFETSAFAGLEEFSHVEVIFVFDKVRDDEITTGARHPRGRTEWPKTGIFAQRGKNRPNRIGVTVCRILSVAGLELAVEGLDAIDGTPVLDIKPYMSGFAPRGEIREPLWAGEIMKLYW